MQRENGLEFETRMYNGHPVNVISRDLNHDKVYYYQCSNPQCRTRYTVARQYARTIPTSGLHEYRMPAHRCPNCGQLNDGYISEPWVRTFSGYLNDD